MSPEEKFGPVPDRRDQMSGYESGYRDGYAAAINFMTKVVLQANHKKKAREDSK